MNEPDTPRPPKKRSVKRTAPKKKIVPNLAIINRPVARFSVQDALVRRGIYLINPSNYRYLKGYLNISALYLTFTPPCIPNDKGHRTLGFLPEEPCATQENNQPPQDLKIDATLYFSYPTDEYALGIGEDGVLYAVFQTWHDAEIEKWQKIAQDIALELSTNEDGSITQRVMFYITSTFLPGDPDAPRQLVIKPRRQFLDDAVSEMGLEIPDEEYEDE